MQTSYEIRWAKSGEWAPAMKMIWETFLKYDSADFTQEGIKNFFDFITDGDLHTAFLNGTYQMMVALDGTRIVGAGTLRNGNHLSLLFVDAAYHCKGIGESLVNELCSYLREEAGERFMTVTSSPYAVGFYQKIGFRVTRPEEERSGIRVTAMEKFI